MTKATPKKKTTTTKKKPTVKAHRGFAHVPLRGRRRPVGDPPRRRPPIQQPIGTPRRPMTPAQRDALRRQRQLALRRQRQLSRMSPRERMQFMFERDLRAGNVTNRNTFGGNLTPAQRDRMRRQLEDAAKRQLDRPVLPIRRRPTVEQLKKFQNQAFKDAQRKAQRKRRRPVGDPKPRRRVTPARQQVTQATQAPRTRRKPRRV